MIRIERFLRLIDQGIIQLFLHRTWRSVLRVAEVFPRVSITALVFSSLRKLFPPSCSLARLSSSRKTHRMISFHPGLYPYV